MKLCDLKPGDLVRSPCAICQGAGTIVAATPLFATVEYLGLGKVIIEKKNLEYWRGPTILDWEKVE